MNIGKMVGVEENNYYRCHIVDKKDFVVGEVVFSDKELSIIKENETTIKALTKTKHLVILEKI